MSGPVSRFTPSRRYLSLAMAAAGGILLSAWIAMGWAPAWIAAGLFLATALSLLVLALQPAIEIHESHLRWGRRSIAWRDVRRVDQTGWMVPLAIHLALQDGRRVLLVYPGDQDSSSSLLRHIRRNARLALIDGVPYRQFWGEPSAPEARALTGPKYQLLRPEDEAEVERMFQRLKSVGRLEPRGSDEE